MLAKAATLPADEVVVDLEDGVAAAAKEEARGHLPGARALGTLAIRINGLTTPWWRDDLAAVAEAPPDVVVVPKVESADDVATVAELLPTGVGLEVQIETARGLVEVERIAAADEEGPARHGDLEAFGLDARQLQHDVQGRRVVGPEAVALGAEAVPQAGEARHLPEVGEQLLDLAPEIVDIALATGHRSSLPVWATVKAWHACSGSCSAASGSSSTPGLPPFATCPV